MNIKKTLITFVSISLLIIALSGCKEKDLGKLDSSVPDEQCAVLHINGLYLTKIDDVEFGGYKWLTLLYSFEHYKVIKLPAGYHTVGFADTSRSENQSGIVSLPLDEMTLGKDFEAGKEYTINIKPGLTNTTYSLVPYTKK